MASRSFVVVSRSCEVCQRSCDFVLGVPNLHRIYPKLIVKGQLCPRGAHSCLCGASKWFCGDPTGFCGAPKCFRWVPILFQGVWNMLCKAQKLLHGAYLYRKGALRCLDAAWNGFRVAPEWFIGPLKCCRGVRNFFQDAPIWLSGAQFHPCGAPKCLRGFSM